jgi:hypothetical protein
MGYKPESKYPSRLSYVLKLSHEAGPAALAGRLENLVTGARREFASSGELLEFLARDLAAGSEELSAGAPGQTHS